jgi:adenosylcobinamide kinase/adenosylcobinamide-phosphate guanylyltransferase
MVETARAVGHELILGGQRSGKSRCAERRAVAWLAQPGHSALLLATAVEGDDEMRSRVARHRADRAVRVPAMGVLEVPRQLAQAVREHSAPQRLLVIDCLTLWLTNLLMPLQGQALDDTVWSARREALCEALRDATGPVLLVSNEVGFGIAPLTPEARRYVDELGHLHQAVAALCADVTLMVAGIEVAVKRGAV